MVNSTLLIGIVMCMVLIAGIFFGLSYMDNKTKDIPRQYQGPIPEGYDEEYFRETGITRPLEDING